tara:strand:+ start:103 stop:450 length:348 start_codon:yes stop_codon:yes gene_type:complete
MAKYQHPRDRKGESRRKPRKGGNRGRGFDDKPRGRRDSGRDSRRDSRYSRDRKVVEKTRVTCSDCGNKCEVPFKPTSNKPVFCSECFEKKGKSGGKGLDVINAKLDKIMAALDIE